MDSFSHAIIISIFLVLIGKQEHIPFGILGAVIIDIDVIFKFFSDSNPGLYIFTHGGVTHSFVGAAILASLSYLLIALLRDYIPFKENLTLSFGVMAFFAVMLGAFSHIMIDYLAYPGIPLAYPFSDFKYTFGILAGPSVIIMAASIVYAAAIVTGRASISQPTLYIAIFLVVLALSAGLKFYVDDRADGMKIPTMNPLKWIIINENEGSFNVRSYDLLTGKNNLTVFDKYNGLSMGEEAVYIDMPEVRRMKYHSYISTVEKNGTKISFHDPLREKGLVWYPPYFKNVSIVDGKALPEKNSGYF